VRGGYDKEREVARAKLKNVLNPINIISQNIIIRHIIVYKLAFNEHNVIMTFLITMAMI